MLLKNKLGPRDFLLGFLCLAIILSCTLIVSIAEEPTDSANSNKENSAAEEPPTEAEVLRAKLKSMSLDERLNQPITLDLRNIDVLEALKFLSTKGNLNIVATKNVAGRVTLTLESVPLKDVFDLILRSNGLAYVKMGEIFNVMTEAEYKALYGKNFFDLRKVKILRLQYAVPEQAFSLLDAIKSDIGRVLVDQESGNVLVMDTPEYIERMQRTLDEFEKKNTVEVFTLKYAKAKEVEDILKTQLDAKKVGYVKADERNNQIIVQTFPERMQEVKRMIASLDKVTKEVLIDTKIVKIKLIDELDQGLEWEGIFNVAKKFGTTYVGSYPFSDITAGQSTATFIPRTQVLANLSGNIGSYPFSGTTSSLNAGSKVSPGQNIHFGVIDNFRDFDVLVNYLNTLGKTRVLSNPKIVVVNNQEAKIHVGERQAYVTTTTTTGQSTSTISEEVQFVDVGIQLSVTPNINDDGYITMKIKPEISSVTSILTTPTNNKIPIIDTSLTETTVMMKDGTTLLIGGLRREDKIASSEQTPFLAKIPLIGFAFKSASNRTERTELLVVITPHIISGSKFTTGNERDFGVNPGKEYEDYKSITPDKTMISRGEAAEGIKPSREGELKDKGFTIKDYRYEPN